MRRNYDFDTDETRIVGTIVEVIEGEAPPACRLALRTRDDDTLDLVLSEPSFELLDALGCQVWLTGAFDCEEAEARSFWVLDFGFLH